MGERIKITVKRNKRWRKGESETGEESKVNISGVKFYTSVTVTSKDILLALLVERLYQFMVNMQISFII